MSTVLRNRIAYGVVCILAAPALLLPAACLLYLVDKGLPALNWDMLLSARVDDGFGTAQGILPQIAGSLVLMLGACVLGAPVALGTALYYTLRAGRGRQASLRALLHILQGIPPIIYGLCGLIVLINLLHWGISLLTGAVILAMVILPLLVLNTIAAIERIAPEYSEAARALGLPDGPIVRRVLLPQAWPALLTGLLLGMARALSETAPILFTATVFSGVTWPDSVFSPVTTLQTHIFYLAQEGADPRAVDMAWGSAVVLVGLVTLFSLSAQVLRWKERKTHDD